MARPASESTYDATMTLLRRLAKGHCLCLGFPPACDTCEARAALREHEKREAKR